VLDVLLAPGFLDGVRQTALLLKQRLAEIRDRYPNVIAEVRGEGLLLGLRTHVPNGALVDALRAEQMLVPAAGENVVRLLPPLIIGEAEVAAAIEKIDRACARLSETATPAQRVTA
jgi:acetylornithine/N-succinyldiaminopimelate aminotransferase